MIRRKLAFLTLLALLPACSSEALQEGDAAGGGGAPSAGTGGAGPNGPALSHAAYPAGPYGRGEGATLPNLSFLGWHHPDVSNYDPAALEEVSLADFYNPDGSAEKPRLLMINASAVWCVVCRAEYKHFANADVYASFRPKGLEILGVLFEDNDYNPARPSDLAFWGGTNGFNVKFPLVIDPGFKVGPFFTSDATPMNLLVDTTTMRIVDISMGYDTSNPDRYWSAIEALLAK